MRFFKYVTADTARLILENGKLRWSSPFMFNDPFDVQFDLHLEFDESTIIDLIIDELWQIYSGKKPLRPNNALGYVFQNFIQWVPNLTKEGIFERQGLRQAIAESVNRTKQLLPELHITQRTLLADAKLLCLSETHNNILMWSHYSGDHTGAVLELERSERDSPLKKAEKVIYSKTMPRLMTETDMVQFFSGQWRLNADAIMHNSIFVKAADWSYEKEWRIWLPGTDRTQQFIDIEFDKTELVGIWFGCRMSEEYRELLLNILKKNFPNATAHRGDKTAREFALEFKPL